MLREEKDIGLGMMGELVWKEGGEGVGGREELDACVAFITIIAMIVLYLRVPCDALRCCTLTAFGVNRTFQGKIALSISVCLSIYLSVCLSVCLLIHLFAST